MTNRPEWDQPNPIDAMYEQMHRQPEYDQPKIPMMPWAKALRISGDEVKAKWRGHHFIDHSMSRKEWKERGYLDRIYIPRAHFDCEDDRNEFLEWAESHRTGISQKE